MTATEVFRVLLQTGRPVAADSAELQELDVSGSLVRNESGEVVGLHGLSVEPTSHEIRFDGQRRWTWCAYDAVGILAALGQGRVRSRSPSGASIEIDFQDHRPLPSEAVVFFAESPPSCRAVEDWCPLVNFFENEQEARGWSERTGVKGNAVPVDEAARRGAAQWRRLV